MTKLNKIKIELNSLLDGSFRFYINDYFRDRVFHHLKVKHKDWRIVAKRLNMNARNLFGIRRGFEYRNQIKKKYFINAEWLNKMQKECDISIKLLEKHIEIIKLGTSGRQTYINLPASVQLNKEASTSVKRVLGEYIYTKELEEKLDFHKPGCSQQCGYFVLSIRLSVAGLEPLRLRGLRPKLKEGLKYYRVSYRNPGTNERAERVIPKSVIFNEKFAKEYGKWIGDRCGGTSKVGVANKEISFINEFKYMLMSELHQPEQDIFVELTHNSSFLPTQELTKHVQKVRLAKTQLGNYAFRVEISNKILKRLLFDKVEKNIFEYLWFSPDSVRYAFFAGLFEAEGSVIKNSHNISFAFGTNLKNQYQFPMLLLTRVVKFKKILKKDGFCPKISRKIANTDKSSTLKYDLILLNSHRTRKKEISFIKQTILPYITYKAKRKQILALEQNCGKTQKD